MEGVSQMTILLYKPYLVKVATTLVGGGQNSGKNSYVVCVWPLTTLIFMGLEGKSNVRFIVWITQPFAWDYFNAICSIHGYKY